MNLGLHDLVLWKSEPQARKNLDQKLLPHHLGHLFDNRSAKLRQVSKTIQAGYPTHDRHTDYLPDKMNTATISSVKELEDLL